MYEAPEVAGVLDVGPITINTPSATTMEPCAYTTPGLQQSCGRQGTPINSQHRNYHPLNLSPARVLIMDRSSSPVSTDSASARPESSCWRRRHQLHQQQYGGHQQQQHQHQLLNDAVPMSPGRNDLAAAASVSPLSRRGSATIKLPPQLALGLLQPQPHLQALLPGSSCDINDADINADALGGFGRAMMKSSSQLLSRHPLPSMVPDQGEEQQLPLLAQSPSTPSRGRGRDLGSSQGSRGPSQLQPQRQGPGTSLGNMLLWGQQDPVPGADAMTAGDLAGGSSLFSSSSPSNSTSVFQPRARQDIMPLRPSTPNSMNAALSCSLRIPSMLASQPHPLVQHQQQQPQPQSPQPQYSAAAAEGGKTAAAAAAAALASAVVSAISDTAPLKSSSYKTQMRRLHGVVSALGDVEGCSEDEEGDEEGGDAGRGLRAARSAGGNTSSSGAGRLRLLLLPEQSSDGLDEVASMRADGPQAWGDTTESAPGSSRCLNATFGGRASGAPSSTTTPAKSPPGSGPGSAAGFSRRLEDLPAAPSPAYSRSLGGSVSTSNRPCTASGQGGGGGGSSSSAFTRPSLAWQPSISSNGSASSVSIGFSRRLEDLPAAPSPVNSRSLAGGGRSSGASTPASPGAGGVGGGCGGAGPAGSSFSTVQRAAQQLIAMHPPQPRTLPGEAVAAGGTADTLQSLALPLQQQQHEHQHQHTSITWRAGEAAQAPQPPAVSPAASVSPFQLQQPSVLRAAFGIPPSTPSAFTSGEVSGPLQPRPPSTGVAINGTGSCRSIRVLAVTGAPAQPCSLGPASSAAVATAMVMAPRPPPHPQSIQGVGFSRRLEDLPAAPSPANSRSLAGGANSSAGSSTLLRFSPRTPPSPSASDAGVRSSMTRRLEELPAAPHPSQSQSLRPDSSCAVFRSHAAAAGGQRSPATPKTPPSPLAWQQSAGGAGTLLASLNSPSPQSVPYPVVRGGGGGVDPPSGQQHFGMDDVIDLPSEESDTLECLPV